MLQIASNDMTKYFIDHAFKICERSDKEWGIASRRFYTNPLMTTLFTNRFRRTENSNPIILHAHTSYTADNWKNNDTSIKTTQ